jgi:hypothetical protein
LKAAHSFPGTFQVITRRTGRARTRNSIPLLVRDRLNIERILLWHGGFVTASLLALSAFGSAHASLIINATFDFATFGVLGSTQRTQAQNTINSVIQTYQNEILNSITVNINFKGRSECAWVYALHRLRGALMTPI